MVWMVVGLSLIWILLRKDEKVEHIKRSFRKYTTGQFKPDPDLGRTDGLTQDDIAWAIENGATDNEEILDLVSKHKVEFGG